MESRQDALEDRAADDDLSQEDIDQITREHDALTQDMDAVETRKTEASNDHRQDVEQPTAANNQGIATALPAFQ